jgi:hypothetical protein
VHKSIEVLLANEVHGLKAISNDKVQIAGANHNNDEGHHPSVSKFGVLAVHLVCESEHDYSC